VLLEALERPEADRSAFLTAACAGDASLRREVESLIASSNEADSFLEAPAMAAPDGSPDAMIGRSLGGYRILSTLGAGGMGEVFLAHDSRLGRKVALKLLPEAVSANRDRLRRFRQEASAASALNHPNILVVHEIGEADGRHYIVTEHVEGETLRARIDRGRLPVSEALEITRQLTSALAAAHAAGFVHRDVKPANVMLRRDGYVKLLDFGLAKLVAPSALVVSETEADTSTTPGMVLGTASYMSPEQARGLAVDERTDVWSLGVVLFEMVTGRVPFEGETQADILSAILAKEPPSPRQLAPEVPPALDRIVRRALEKTRTDRYQTVGDLGAAVSVLAQKPDRSGARARGPTGGSRFRKRPKGTTAAPKSRLIALPFRILRADEETDFLAFSLPDAITSSLSGLDALVARSSLVAARFADEPSDLKRIAAEADVDVVLTGTLLRAGGQLRVCTQLVAAPAGTVLWSLTSDLTLGEIFQLQDELVHRIVESLSLRLTTREHSLLKRDVPATPRAYEFYLRANQLMQRIGAGHPEAPLLARDLYRRGLEEDPLYAPAWAALARCCRLLSRFGGEPEETMKEAESCLRRALDLNPDLTLGHKLYAQLETDLGRAADATSRLLRRTHPGSADAELFAGLVYTCRYCGLLEASVAAHERARRLDPKVVTSVRHTYWLLGEYERALEHMGTNLVFFDALVLTSIGRESEAVSILQGRERQDLPEAMRVLIVSLRAVLEGRRAEALEATERSLALFRDPEARYYLARQLACLGAHDRALAEIGRVVDDGFHCPQILARDPWLDPLRGAPEFQAIVARAEDHRRRAAARFLEDGGDRLLGV
jgi:serine/threonine protein kinase/tetratricopeptide (TPR) repeat protein